MNKEEQKRIALQVGMRYSIPDVSYSLQDGEIVCTQIQLLAFANAIADAQREKDAKICDERSNKCAAKADRLEDADDIAEQKSLAWQFSVLAAVIRANKE